MGARRSAVGTLQRSSADNDPRRLRELLGRVSDLADEHALTSVVVGMAGAEGDRVFPEVVDFVVSALRVDDSIVRMTRERSVLFLTDVDRSGAQEIMSRLLRDFGERFPAVSDPPVALGYFEVTPATRRATLKDVLLALFVSPNPAH
jgi:hypothetical protein